MHMTHANVALRALSVRQDWSNVQQIVEFGGGTGDMCAATLDMGFQGTYIVYVSAAGPPQRAHLSVRALTTGWVGRIWRR